jgi:hypothetical protein
MESGVSTTTTVYKYRQIVFYQSNLTHLTVFIFGINSLKMHL